MGRIINIGLARETAEYIKNQNKTIVLTGGVFDILHIGHIKFLQKAKKEGDVLFVMLESDQKARKEKGAKRPINSINERTEVLSSISYIDYIIPLTKLLNNQQYDKLIKDIRPNIIAITKGSDSLQFIKRQAKMANAKIVEVTPLIKNKSTTNIANLISKKF